jgi:hypothetical protein
VAFSPLFFHSQRTSDSRLRLIIPPRSRGGGQSWTTAPEQLSLKALARASPATASARLVPRCVTGRGSWRVLAPSLHQGVVRIVGLDCSLLDRARPARRCCPMVALARFGPSIKRGFGCAPRGLSRSSVWCRLRSSRLCAARVLIDSHAGHGPAVRAGRENRLKAGHCHRTGRRAWLGVSTLGVRRSRPTGRSRRRERRT